MEVQALMLAVGHLGFDRMMVTLLFGIKVTDACPVIDAVLSGHSSRGHQNRINETGLAAGAMSAKRNVATLADSY